MGSSINFTECRVKSFADLADLVEPFRKDGEWVFRGVRSGDYGLLPKVGRPGARRNLATMEHLPYDAAAEDTMVRHFIRAASPYVKHIPSSRLEWLALAQHHGLPTRLLDWTESLFVAAYFAVEEGHKPHTALPTIYGVRNVAVIESGPAPDPRDAVRLFYPPHISPRIPAQSALFTVHPSPATPWQPQGLVRIVIEQTTLSLKLDLNACGVHRASLFPDIDGLARHQAWLHKWDEHMDYGDNHGDAS